MRGQSLSTTTAAGAASVTGGGISGTGTQPATNWASSERCRLCVTARLDPGEVSTCFLFCFWFIFKISLYAIFLLKNQYLRDIKSEKTTIGRQILIQSFNIFCWLKMISMLMNFSFHSMAVEHFEENQIKKKNWYLN